MKRKINSGLTQKNFLKEDQRGFSLVEALITILIFSILSAACLSVFVSASGSYQMTQGRAQLQGEMRKGVNWLKNELRQSGSAGITNVLSNGTAYTSITFKTATGTSSGITTWSANTIQYALSGTNLQRTTGGVARTICQNVQSVSFTRQTTTPDIVDISLAGQLVTQKGTILTQTLNFKVELRN